MQILQIIQAAIPEATEELADYILWERSPYPFTLDAKQLYKAASRVKRANDHNIRLCELCNNMLHLDDNCNCKRCQRLLDRNRANHEHHH